jgi:hypothetical protein
MIPMKALSLAILCLPLTACVLEDNGPASTNSNITQNTDPYDINAYTADTSNPDDPQGLWLVIGKTHTIYQPIEGYPEYLDSHARVTCTLLLNGDGKYEFCGDILEQEDEDDLFERLNAENNYFEKLNQMMDVVTEETQSQTLNLWAVKIANIADNNIDNMQPLGSLIVNESSGQRTIELRSFQEITNTDSDGNYQYYAFLGEYIDIYLPNSSLATITLFDSADGLSNSTGFNLSKIGAQYSEIESSNFMSETPAPDINITQYSSREITGTVSGINSIDDLSFTAEFEVSF